MNKEIKLSTTKLDVIPKNFKLFYCTFGYGQENSGCVQPVYAKNISDVHKIMLDSDWLDREEDVDKLTEAVGSDGFVNSRIYQ